jgi:uncharacterized protein
MHTNIAMKDFVIRLLNDKLPTFYYYHNYKHTLYVLDKAMEIGVQENCIEKEMRLLNAAALWHDTGYINSYTGHEEESCHLAKQYLPEYGFSNEDINKICGMIMATKIPQSPKDKLEEIFADADLEYLGTENAASIADSFFKEQHSINPLLTKEEWDKTQIAFIEKHHFFTKYCKETKEPVKKEYLNKLINSNI